jgi:proteasome-associated ATPase
MSESIFNPDPYYLQNTLLASQKENENLRKVLAGAKEMLAKQKEEIEKLNQPPNAMGVFEQWVDQDEGTAYVMVRGERMYVHSALENNSVLVSGKQVIFNEVMAIIDFEDEETVGEVVTLVALLDDSRAIVTSGQDNELVVNVAVEVLDNYELADGDKLLMNKAKMVYEILPEVESEGLLLERVPDITYDQVGGLTRQVGQIKDAIELPITQADLFKVYNLDAPKGVLLYGPPGCGKTLIAKAVANSLSKHTGGNAYFINIKGPELLNKWVGETERQIRDIFEQARRKATDGNIVVVFFDEMESLFRQRGAGVSSDMESTVVPALLAEIDGVEEVRNVVVIGASNRPDLIDPAVLRPGRLDIKVQIERPDAEAAADIFALYLNDSIPIHPDEAGPAAMISELVERIYAASTENEFLEVTYEKGQIEKLYFRDFLSGAMIANIVARGKRIAIKEEIATGARGVRLDHLMVAINEEFRENEDLPNTTNPDDWARISGRKGAKILGVRSIVQERAKPTTTEVVGNTGQYL